MIPRHRPPFNVIDLATVLLRGTTETTTVEQVEAAFAEACGCPFAILLPSARAGICWALRAAVGQETLTVGPAYTCQVVHEAIARSSRNFHFVDSEPNGFLIDLHSLDRIQNHDYALVLSEVYGHSYLRASISELPATGLRVRVVDAAMTIPTFAAFQNLERTDFAVTSFGLGKSMYAGWGGIGFTKDENLAVEVKARRSFLLRNESLPQLFCAWVEIMVRTIAHERPIYGFASKFRKPPQDHHTFPSEWSGDRNLSKEWLSPPTLVHRSLAQRNLERALFFYQKRIELAHCYEKNLAGVERISLPPPSTQALSHYTIRVGPGVRAALQFALRKRGIDAGALFRWPAYLSPAEYTNGSRIASEVLNLPLDPCLTVEDVDHVCGSLIACMIELCRKGKEPGSNATTQEAGNEDLHQVAKDSSRKDCILPAHKAQNPAS